MATTAHATDEIQPLTPNFDQRDQPADPAPPTLESRRQQLLEAYARIRVHYSEEQKAAITLLYETAQQMLDTGGGSTCGKLLLGLYNGNRFRFDLTDLRRLDGQRRAAAMVVIEMDARSTYAEVHQVLNAIYADGRNTGGEFEEWAYRLRWGKHVKKDSVPKNNGPKWARQ
jgi:hypothetical protein